MTGTVVIIYLVVWIAIEWLFYKWGASIAQKKGRSRALGWWAVFFTWIAIIVLYLLPDQSGVSQYVPPSAGTPKVTGVAERIERLAMLHDKGALNDEEFERAKAEALRGG